MRLPAILATFALALLALAGAREAHAASRTCSEVSGDVATARAGGDLDGMARLWGEAKAAEAGCAEQALYCLGQSIALGFVEAAYRKGDEGAGADAIAPLLAEGLAYGSPWQLRVGLGDARLALARRAHDGAGYSAAALDYQEALIGLDQPAVCDGEPPRPAADAVASLYQRMSTALLLANPVKVATTRCAPCQWLFMAGISGFTPATRPLPITFAENSSTPTPEGLTAAAALLECARAAHYSQIVLSGHTDRAGSAGFNLALSARRLEVVRKLLADGGFAGEVVLQPKGESEPYVAGDTGYSPAELGRLNRRIEFRGGVAPPGNACS